MFEKGRAVDNPMISLLLGASCSNIKNTYDSMARVVMSKVFALCAV